MKKLVFCLFHIAGIVVIIGTFAVPASVAIGGVFYQQYQHLDRYVGIINTYGYPYFIENLEPEIYRPEVMESFTGIDEFLMNRYPPYFGERFAAVMCFVAATGYMLSGTRKEVKNG